MIDHLNAVVLPVRDLEKCTSFYKEKLGFKLKNKDDNSAFFGLGDNERIILGLISMDNVAESRRNRFAHGRKLSTEPITRSSSKTSTENIKI